MEGQGKGNDEDQQDHHDLQEGGQDGDKHDYVDSYSGEL